MLSDSAPLTDTERHALVGSALRLSYFTIVWNGVVGATALVIGLTTGSLALAGFALNALLDSSASVVLVWRFRKERSDPVAAEHLERRAQTWVIAAMLAVALYVGVEAVRALIERLASRVLGVRLRHRSDLPAGAASSRSHEAARRRSSRESGSAR